DNSKQKNSRWYSGSGIYRHVWLKVKNPIHIKNWGVGISTPQVTNEKAKVQVKTIVKNETASPQSILLATNITNKKGKAVANTDIKIELQPNEEKEITQNLAVENPALWSLETPNLYTANVNIRQGNKDLDVITKNFGIRTIEFSAENGFLL